MAEAVSVAHALRQRRRGLPVAILGAVAAATLLLVGLAGPGQAQAPAGTTREYFIAAVKYKGTTTADKLAPPEESPQELSRGYGFSAPGYDGSVPLKWEVSSYVWTPAVMLAFRGDQIELTAFVVNGDEHKVWVEGPDGEEVLPEMALHRGRQYELRFAVPKAGIYRLLCQSHEPTMVAHVLVLPPAEGGQAAAAPRPADSAAAAPSVTATPVPALPAVAMPAAAPPAAPTQAAGATLPAAAGSSSAQLVLKDFAFEPAQLTVRAGSVRFQLLNRGRYTHDLRLQGGPFDERSPRVGAGRELSWEVTLAPGEYLVSCPVADHALRGMMGKLVVTRS